MPDRIILQHPPHLRAPVLPLRGRGDLLPRRIHQRIGQGGFRRAHQREGTKEQGECDRVERPENRLKLAEHAPTLTVFKKSGKAGEG